MRKNRKKIEKKDETPFPLYILYDNNLYKSQMSHEEFENKKILTPEQNIFLKETVTGRIIKAKLKDLINYAIDRNLRALGLIKE